MLTVTLTMALEKTQGTETPVIGTGTSYVANGNSHLALEKTQGTETPVVGT